MIPVSFSLFLYFSLFLLLLLLFYVIIYCYKNFIIIIIIILFIYFFLKIILFFHVPGCSGMFRNVPACSGMFHVPGFIDGPLKVAFGNSNDAIFENFSKLRASLFVTSR